MFPENTYIHINTKEEAQAVCDYYTQPENGGYDFTDLLDYALEYPYFAVDTYDESQITGWCQIVEDSFTVLEYSDWERQVLNISDFEPAPQQDFINFILSGGETNVS